MSEGNEHAGAASVTSPPARCSSACHALDWRARTMLILPRCARTLSMLVVLGSVLAADETMKHYHRGKLPKYELSAPSIMLSAGDEEVLNKGKALMQVIVQADGKRRLLMVRDVATPAWVVMERILDFPAYPRMVKGCDAMVPYHDKREVRALTPG